MPASAANAPPPMTQPGVLPKRSSKNEDDFAGALASAFGAGALAGGAVFGGSTGAGTPALGGSGAFVSGAAATFGGSAFGGSAFGGSGALTGGGGATAARRRRRAGRGVGVRRQLPAPAAPLSASARCRSCNVFSSSVMRVCASLSALSRDTTSSATCALARLRRHLELVASRRRGRHLFLDGRADLAAGSAAARGLGRRRRARDLVLVGAPIGRPARGRSRVGLVRRASPRLRSALGMLRIAPARSRFMLPSKAFGLLL